MKLCKNCVYFRAPYVADPRPAKCHHSEAYIDTDLIYGNVKYQTCEYMRINKCGPEGKLYAGPTR